MQGMRWIYQGSAPGIKFDGAGILHNNKNIKNKNKEDREISESENKIKLITIKDIRNLNKEYFMVSSW